MNFPPPSPEYENLIKRLDEIENNYEIASMMAVPPYDLTSKQLDMCRGYRLLCHAEIESYIEEKALTLLNYSREIWRKSSEVNIVIVSLLANFRFIENKNGQQNMTTTTKIYKIFKEFEGVIENNHGIKQKNIFNLFIPLGIEENEFDPAWLSTMDTYGSKRGETAHSSFQTQQPIDLSTEKSSLLIILSGLLYLDKKVLEICILS
ncbi:HEPN domain-containing protein [Exiguobacterium sp. s155]|uniref:HEPN domain-containing protein n=1 Tax=Exiguobacterium sp. s155 TaxID=2751286 RepID=UPI001BE603C3|nr:HEPN domain-containing protein [Exiguobacterium sp. s155]